jgi:hypothetical protein
MRGLARYRLARGLLPDDLPGFSIEREDDMTMQATRLDTPERLMRSRGINVLGYGRQQEDAIAPDDGRGRTTAGDFHFPSDVLRFAPLDGRVSAVGRTGCERTTPLRPVRLTVGIGRAHRRHERERQSERHHAGAAGGEGHRFSWKRPDQPVRCHARLIEPGFRTVAGLRRSRARVR